MFKFKKQKADQTTPNISSDFETIIYEDGPILYFGKNNQGNSIMGLSIDEDDKRQVKWFIHVPIDNATLLDFFLRKKSFLKILKEAKNLYLFERSYDAKCKVFYSLKFKEIPEEYLPLNDSLCPKFFIDKNCELIETLRLEIKTRADLPFLSLEKIRIRWSEKNSNNEFWTMFPSVLSECDCSQIADLIHSSLNFGKESVTASPEKISSPSKPYSDPHLINLSNDLFQSMIHSNSDSSRIVISIPSKKEPANEEICLAA
jgi:hypothetical protein